MTGKQKVIELRLQEVIGSTSQMYVKVYYEYPKCGQTLWNFWIVGRESNIEDCEDCSLSFVVNLIKVVKS